MVRKFKELDFVKNKKWTLARIMKIDGDIVKLRCISMLKNKLTGTYQWQYIMKYKTLQKNWKMISTKKLLHIIYYEI